MQIIGFNFSSIQANREKELKFSGISTNIEFTSLEKESISLIKDQEALKIDFSYSVIYDKENKEEESKNKLVLTGVVIVSVSKDESKELLKSWKKKELDQESKIPIFNFILSRCTPKALNLEEELNLPFHIPLPKIQAKPKDN